MPSPTPTPYPRKKREDDEFADTVGRLSPETKRLFTPTPGPTSTPPPRPASGSYPKPSPTPWTEAPANVKEGDKWVQDENPDLSWGTKWGEKLKKLFGMK